MKLSELFTFMVSRAGRVERYTLPEDHTDVDLELAAEVTRRLPPIFTEVRASEARTDHLDIADAPTMRIQVTPPKPTSSWFEKE